MCLEIRKLSIDDGCDIYEMLRELPAEENGFINSVNNKTYDEYKEWLRRSAKNSDQVGVIDGWKVPETIFWLLENNSPVGFGKVRHFLTDALLENGGNGIHYSSFRKGKRLGKEALILFDC